MSWSTQFLAVRDALSEHVIAAWDCNVYLGTMQSIPKTADLPAALLIKADGPTTEENTTPTRKTSTVQVLAMGAWSNPGNGVDLESYAAARAEELRALIDDDHNLGGTCNMATVAGIDWALPNAVDPNDGRLYVTVQISVEYEYAR